MQQVAPGLYVSGIEDAGNPEKLTSRGITAVLKLTHGSPSEPYPERVRVASHPLVDGPRNDFRNFEAAVEALVSMQQAEETVLVHCSAGSSRSGAVTAAALAHRDGTTVEAALDRIQRQKSDIDPHPALLDHARKTNL